MSHLTVNYCSVVRSPCDIGVTYVRGVRVPPLFGVGVPYPLRFGRITEKNNDFPSYSAPVSPYNIQENVWRLGRSPRNRVGAHIAPTRRPI